MNAGKLLPETLAAYVKRAQPILIEVAKRKGTITYGKLMSRLGGGPGRRYIGEVVGRISEIEYQNRHPKLSAVVVTAATGMVGGGFFGLSETPENVRRSTREEFQDCRLSAADKAYWHQELKRVYNYPWQ
jgi:hypothetical protein